jgi:hypothetical protein
MSLSPVLNDIRTIVGTMPIVFDAHDVISVLHNDPKYQPNYNSCAKSYKTTISFHAAISRYISDLPGITTAGKVRSLNIHNVVSQCMRYKK